MWGHVHTGPSFITIDATQRCLPHEVGALFLPLFYGCENRPSKVESLAQSHTAKRWWSWDLHPVLSGHRTHFLGCYCEPQHLCDNSVESGFGLVDGGELRC